MRLGELAVRNRATVFFLIVAVVILGALAYRDLPRESFPDISIPVITVLTPYPGASPVDVETQITDELEKELKGIEGLKKLTSSSTEGFSSVVVEFVSGTDVDVALQKVRDRVDLAKAEFPDDAEEPVLQEINLSDIPVVQFHLSGDVGPAVLKRIAKELQDDLEGIGGVLKADVVGGLDREVKVEVDPERLRLYGLSLDDVIDAVRDENVSIPAGDLDLGRQSFAVRVPGEVADPLQVADFVITAKGQQPVHVRDVAEVSYGFLDRISFARVGGRESVALLVQKRAGANIIDLVDQAKAAVERARERWPAGVEVTLLGDQSKDIRRMVKDLENSVLTGMVLVVAVLFVALGLRNALFVGVAIPLAMLATFMVLQLSGMTLNMMVLFSLVLAVGMIVDNSIVVVDNIFRHVQEGRSPDEAAEVGSREVGYAILNSTLTTLAAFSPLFFWPGIVGDFMSYLPIAVSIALVASLVVAFTANPAFASAFMRRGGGRRLSFESDEQLVAEGGLAARFVHLYRWSLEFALDHRLLTVGGTVALFVLVLALFPVLGHGVEFFPETEPLQILANVETPPGTRLEHTDAIVRQVEERLRDLPDIRVLAAGVGAGVADDFGGYSPSGNPTRGRVTLDLLDRADRAQNSFVTLAQARERVRGIPGATINVERPQEGPPVGDPLTIEIAGDDFQRLGEIAARIRAAVADIPGLATLDDDFDLDRPEVVVHVDRVQAARLGLTTAKIAGTLRTAVNGTKASTFREGEDEWDITVRLPAADRTSLADLGRLAIVNEAGDQIPLETFARLERGAAMTTIKHKDRKRVVTISGKVTSPEQAEPVRAEARRRLAAVPDLLPAGYSLGFAGQSEDEEEAKAFLSRAFLYAVLLVLGLIVAQFNSLAVPLIVMTSVVMSMIGVLAGLVATGLPFGIIMTGIGVISLAGVVVNNAIVLLDYAEQLRRRGLARRAVVVLTGMRRLRPVLLTAITTILGLVPLSTGFEFDFTTFRFSSGGESAQWWRGMGVAVIFGLAFATFLTLVVVPVLYDLLLDFRERRRARKEGRAAGEEGGEAADAPA
ncbi:MAG: efflux RND transporter permease subunit [Thermoanaerobaculia bacterium]|nr:efflux RND transporter permease subunit [Thermoanaerobaculia bacterium]